MGNPQTDIVLPVHDAMEYTTVCLDSLFAHTENFRLILVDDYSTVEMSAYLMSILQRQPTALYIRTAQQKWFTRASNVGLRMVRTPRAVLLNSDCILDNGWLEELYGVWEEVRDGCQNRLVGPPFSGVRSVVGCMAEPGYVCYAVLFSGSVVADIREVYRLMNP
jgi:glycosyltransferase involved in cell wall biosynthesis